MSAFGRQPLALSASATTRRRAWSGASAAVFVIYLVLAIGLSFTRVPICDEGWYTSPTMDLLHRGSMGSPVLESAGSYLKGIEHYTYWIMPLHGIIQMPWFELFGSTLRSTRMLSAAAGMAALFCWFYVIRKITGDRSIALLALFLISIDSTVLVLASTGRSDIMSAAFGSAALACYLSLRENRLGWALFSGHALAAASGLTHPNGGLVAVPSLLFIQFYYDRRKFRPVHLVPIALPYLIGAAAWSVYILRAPEFFWPQFGGNSAGRLWPLKAPFTALKREITDRFLPAYGLGPGGHGITKLRVIVLLIYASGALGILWPRSIRRTPASRVFTALIAIVLCVLLFLEGAKQPWYLIHLTWLLAAATAAAYRWHAQRHPSWRPALLGVLAVLVVTETGYAATLIVQRKCARVYQPVIALLQRELRPGQSVIGSAELGFGIGFDRVKDDINLGYYSGRRPDFIVIDPNYDAHLAELSHTKPLIYRYLKGMLTDQYRHVFSNSNYSVYARGGDSLATKRSHVILQASDGKCPTRPTKAAL